MSAIHGYTYMNIIGTLISECLSFPEGFFVIKKIIYF